MRRWKVTPHGELQVALEDKDLLSVQRSAPKSRGARRLAEARAYSREQVDAIVERMAAAAAPTRDAWPTRSRRDRVRQRKDKYIKNILNCDWLPRRMRGMKTVGMLRELPDEKSWSTRYDGRGRKRFFHHESLHGNVQDVDLAQSGQRHCQSIRIPRPQIALVRQFAICQAALEASA